MQRANYCLNCGRKLDADEKFCSSCGQKISPVSGPEVGLKPPVKNVISKQPPVTAKQVSSVDVFELKRNLEKSPSLDEAQVRSYFSVLKEQLQKGELTATAFQKMLGELRLYDPQGSLWTIGAKTGRWYLKRNGQWVEGVPAGKLVFRANTPLNPAQEKPLFCGNCGGKLRSTAKYCNWCGAPRS